MDADVGQSFFRALMRVEAELLAEDADRIGGSTIEVRTAEQRGADALVALVLRITDAADAGRKA